MSDEARKTHNKEMKMKTQEKINLADVSDKKRWELQFKYDFLTQNGIETVPVKLNGSPDAGVYYYAQELDLELDAGLKKIIGSSYDPKSVAFYKNMMDQKKLAFPKNK